MDYEIVHTCIRVLNLEKSMEFYEKALGFKVVKRKDFKDEKFTLVFMSDGKSAHELELTYNYDREEPYDIGNGYSHLALVVDDLKKSHEEHSKGEYKVTKLNGLPGAPVRFYFIFDPDGYSIEIIQK
ncbi:lactoylglutathione lyase [Alkalibaculum sp. M08DMB]|uniref:Aldoketomutase n=1 Tax=Alkalibaculum sporogenes TaxID=2655001 RepID=A0A6A7K5D9_9FIRM|nr:VOC family protein [Alkalibaculum sporogenes]MPW24610.1 lactoylglutathione lyase [Alkalibaculum sporogenes]